MTDHHKRPDSENPVGPEEPLIPIKMPLWQVFLILLFIGIAVTAFKMYERYGIAPHAEIRWQPFEPDRFQRERQARRAILVWIVSPDTGDRPALAPIFERPSVRTSVYLSRCLPFKIEGSDRSKEEKSWIEKHASKFTDGGVVFWSYDAQEPSGLPTESVTAESLVDLIERQ